jgi:Transposase DDE domain
MRQSSSLLLFSFYFRRIYAELAQRLMLQARKLYAKNSFGVDLDAAAYALDSTTIDLCLSLFPRAHFVAAIKMHTLLDLRGNIPSFIRVTTGNTHDVNILDEIHLHPRAYDVMDRGYLDFLQLHRAPAASYSALDT